MLDVDQSHQGAGGRLTPRVIESAFYRVAVEIANSVGVEQGYLLPAGCRPDVKLHPSGNMNVDDLTQFLGLSRADVRRLFEEGRIPGERYANYWITSVDAAKAFKAQLAEGRERAATGRPG